MGQKVIVGTQQFFLNFVVITLEKKGYDALLGRGWLVVVKATHNWKQNTLSIEFKGRKYIIDLKNQLVSHDLASDSKGEDYVGMKPDEEGVLRLGECSADDISSLNGFFHWQMGDYEVFHAECNMLGVQDSKLEEPYTEGYKEYKEGGATLNRTLEHIFEKEV